MAMFFLPDLGPNRLQQLYQLKVKSLLIHVSIGCKVFFLDKVLRESTIVIQQSLMQCLVFYSEGISFLYA